VLLVTALSSCTSTVITNARVCVEIPFKDGAEGACVWTLSRKQELIGSEQWLEQRPTMLMVDPKSWTEIKKDWLKNCRYAGEKCNAHVKSIDDVILELDKMLRGIK